MLRRIGSFIRQDFVNILRDNIGLYMIAAPLIMAVGFSFFIPSVQGAQLTFALEKTMPQAIIETFQEHGRVELIDGKTSLQERVERSDDVIGIYQNPDGDYVLMAEGNETGDLVRVSAAVLDRALQSEPPAVFLRSSLNRDPSLMRETTASMLVLGAILIAGILIAFNIIDEKESRALAALAVSPLHMREYIGARGVLVLVTSLVLSVATAIIIMGFALNYGLLILAIVISTGLGIILGLAVGGLTDTQISAIAAIKLVMIVMTGIPLASLAMPAAWRWLLYPFPNYWVFQVFQNVFSRTHYGLGFWHSSLYVLLTSMVLLMLLMPVIRKRLRLR